MMKRILAIACGWTVLTTAGCDGEPDLVAGNLGPQTQNVRVHLPTTSNGTPLRVDTIGAEPVFRDQIDQRPPIFGSFRLTCPRGGCVRFNLYSTVGSRRGWSAGHNCVDERPDSPVLPVKVEGPLGEVRELRACCPHNKPCNLDRVFNPNNNGGADWIVGVLPNGRLATTVRELRTICPRDVEGAIDYSSHIFGDFTYPSVAASGGTR
jgi:hypothetical protein